MPDNPSGADVRDRNKKIPNAIHETHVTDENSVERTIISRQIPFNPSPIWTRRAYNSITPMQLTMPKAPDRNAPVADFLHYQSNLERRPGLIGWIGQANWEAQKPTSRYMRDLHYLPTAWEDPRTVIRYRNFLQAAPQGWMPPPWLNPASVEQAYKWFEMRNKGKPPAEWGFLTQSDPARSWLQGLDQPPAHLRMPNDRWYEAIPEARAGQDPTFTPQPEGESSTIDWSRVPDWMKAIHYGFSNPDTAPLVQAAFMAAPALLSENYLGFGIGLSFIVPGYMQARPELFRSHLTYLRALVSGRGAESLAESDETTRKIGEALTKILMWSSQTVEQIGGMAQQIGMPTPKWYDAISGPVYPIRAMIELAKNPEKAIEVFGSWENFFAAWEAGKSTYESHAGDNKLAANLPFFTGLPFEALSNQSDDTLKITTQDIMADKGQVWQLPQPKYDNNGAIIGWEYHPTPVTVPAGYTLEDARRRILKGGPGNDPDTVWFEYQQVYGISGVMLDLVASAIADPLNAVPLAEGYVGEKLTGALAAAADERVINLRTAGAVAEQTAKASSYRLMSQAFHASTGQGIFERGGFIDTYGTLVRNSSMRDTLTGVDYFFGRLDKTGAVGEFRQTPVRPKGFRQWFSFLTNLTPDSKARIWHEHALQMFKTIALTGELDVLQMEKLWNSYATQDMKAIRDAGANVLGSPEAYTVLPSARAFQGEAAELFTNYHLADNPREVVMRLSALLGESGPDVVKHLLDEDPTVEFKRLVERAQQSQSAEAKAFLDDMKNGRVTPDIIRDAVKVFENGNVPLTPQEFAAHFLNKLSDHTGKWLTDFYHLEPDSTFFQTARLMKSVQSLALLSLSPSYPLNNFINGEVTMMMAGAWGFMPGWRINEVMSRFGWEGDLQPERFAAGIGAAAEGSDSAGSVRPGESAIRDAVTGKGIIQDVQRAVSAVNNKLGIFSIMAKKMESWQSKRAFATAAEKFYGRHWRVGDGFERMSPNLEAALKSINPAYPDMVYRAIENGYNFNEIKTAFEQGATTRNVQNYIHDAATRMGIDPATAADKLASTGILNYLNENLPKAKTQDGIQQIFNNTERVYRDHVEKLHGQNLVDHAGMIGDKLRAEGFAGAADIWTDIMGQEMDVKNYADMTWDEAYSNADAVWDNTALRRQILGRAAADNDAMYRRFYERQEATIKGVIESMGMDEVNRRSYLLDFIETHRKRGEFFKLKSEEIRKFFNTEYKNYQQRNSAWYTLVDEQNKRYAALVQDELQIAARMDERLAGWFDTKFGQGKGDSVRAWREQVRTLFDERGKMVVAFRDSIKDLPQDVRSRMWQEFKREYFSSFVAEKTADIEGMRRVWQNVTGEEMPAAVSKRVMGADVNPRPPEQTTETPQPLPQDELITPEIARQVEQQAVEMQAQVQSVRQIASEFGLATADENGQPIPGADLELIKRVRAHGGNEGAYLRTMDDLARRPDVVRKALERFQKMTDDQMTLDKQLIDQRTSIISKLQTGDDRRIPAFQKLREIWPSLSDTERAEAMNWIGEQALIDPRTGLETVHAMALEGKAPEGWKIGRSDMNALKAINDTWGHEAGDAVLRGMGDVIRQEVETAGGRAFRSGGDEIEYWFPTQEAAETAMKAIDERFSSAIIEIEVSGEVMRRKGFSVSYGIGETPELADQALYTDKQRRLGTQRSTDRTALPESIVEAPQDAGQTIPAALGDVPAQEVDPLVQRRADFLDHFNKTPIDKLPDLVREPLTRVLSEMLDEAQADRRTSLLETIRRKGGIDVKYLSEITGESKVQRAWGPGLFSKRGLGLDNMARELFSEEGYIQIKLDDPADPTGTNALIELIRNELAGEKQYGVLDEGGLTAIPEWRKNLKGYRQDVVTRAVRQIIDGQDSSFDRLPANALEQRIKAEAFGRLGNLAAQDGALAEATGYKFDIDRWTGDVEEIRNAIPTMTEAEASTAFDQIGSMFGKLPPELQDTAMPLMDATQAELIARLSGEAEVRNISDAYNETQTAIQQGQERSDIVWTRDSFVENQVEAGVPREQAESMGDMASGTARWFERVGAGKQADFWKLALEAIRHGDPEEMKRLIQKIQKGKGLAQDAEYAPVWYSKAERILTDKMPNRADAQTIRNIMAAEGVKADEITWTGLDKWLSEQKGAISKSDILAYVQENQVQVQEVTKGGAGETYRYSSAQDYEAAIMSAERAGNFDLAEGLTTEMEAWAGKPGNGEINPTKFASYVEPGGTNYREVLLTLPIEKRVIRVGDTVTTPIGEAIVEGVRPNGNYVVGEHGGHTVRPREQLGFIGEYRSSHWEEPNVLAHVRLDDRVDVDGKRVLFIEEVQSDWHQAGREKGYRGQQDIPIKIEDIDAKFIPPTVPEGHNPKNYPGYWETYNKNTSEMTGRHSGYLDRAGAIEEAFQYELTKVAYKNEKSVPSAPFSKTWADLSMKRIIRMAAEEGYDRVAWTTGDMQAARYDLAKQVDAVTWHKNQNNTYDLGILEKDTGLERSLEKGITLERVADYVGKNIAEKIQAEPAEKFSGTYTGVDLKVGGEGMKGFYDTILPATAQKYVKKWGAKVGETRIKMTQEQNVITDGKLQNIYADKPVHSFDITDSMRQSVLEQGQPLFQSERTIRGAIEFTDSMKAIYTLFDDANASTMPHEFGHHLRKIMYAVNDMVGGSPEIMRDIATIEEWAGVRNGKWTRKAEEMFTLGYERYLAEGIAPTPALQRVFDNFRVWLLDIYKSITGSKIDVPLTDDVREVFARLLGQEPEAEPLPLADEQALTGRLLPATEGEQMGMGVFNETGGKRTRMDAGDARPVYAVDAGRTAIDRTGKVVEAGDIVSLRDGRQVTVKGVTRAGKIVAVEGDILNPADITRVAEQGTLPGSPLFQDGGDTPTLPTGGYDEVSGMRDNGRIMDEVWMNEIKPLLDGMRQSAMRPEATFFADQLPPQQRGDFETYLRKIRGQQGTARHSTLRWAESMRDNALLPYNRQYGFDKVLQTGVPYEFFMTRTLANTFLRGMDHPAFFANYARLMQAHNTYKNDLPERLRNKYYMPMPFLPEWAGGGTFIDPMPGLFPPAMFMQPLRALQRDEDQKVRNTERIVDEWFRAGKLQQQDAATAITTHAGATWERAAAEAAIRDAQDKNTPFDYFSMLMSPALYATIPYYLATGKPLGGMGWPAGQLPFTRTGQALEAAFKGTSLEPVGNIAGLLAEPERMARKVLGLSEFGEWGDYYIDKQLTNMAAEGTITTQQALMAMQERTGELYDLAYERVKFELMLRTPGAAALYGAAHGAQVDALIGSIPPSLFSGGLLPIGEIEFKGQKTEYNRAWSAYKAGDKNAFDTFFEAYPEYQTRLALFDTPEERLYQFLNSEIWDLYTALGDTHKRQARAALGEDFEAFLFSEDKPEFSAEKLAEWAQALGGIVPQPAQVIDPATNQPQRFEQTGALDFYPPEVADVMDDFYAKRTERFPNWYAIQTVYFSLPEHSAERDRYLLRFPELKRYWDWRQTWKDRYPELENWIDGDVYKNVDTSSWPSQLMDVLFEYVLTGEKLSSGATSLLRQKWALEGKPYGDFYAWLDSAVVPSLINQLTMSNSK